MGDLRLDRFSSFTHEVTPVVYYQETDRLMRAQGFKADGTLDGEVVAYGVHGFDVTLLFLDGDEAPEVNLSDSDFTNDYDDVVGVRIEAALGTDTPDPRLNGGSLITRTYTWHFAPRNLMWERNRM